MHRLQRLIGELIHELGDLLLHVFLYAKLAQELEQFDLGDIIQSAMDKQKRRKLDFKNPQGITAAEALKQWEMKKREEQSHNETSRHLLDAVATSLPGMIRALKLQSLAATVGFDWQNPAPVYDKIQEEILEFQEAVSDANQSHMEEECGDLLFAVINLARHYGINPEIALQKTNRKFISRFNKMEDFVKSHKRTMEDCDLNELDQIWNEVKTRES